METGFQIFSVILFFSWISSALLIALSVWSGRDFDHFSKRFFTALAVIVGLAMFVVCPTIAFLDSGGSVTVTILGASAIASLFLSTFLWFDETYIQPSRRLEHQKKLALNSGSLVKDLDEARRRIRDLVDISGDWIWQTDEKGKIKSVTEGVTDVLGVGPNRLIGRTLFDVSDIDPTNEEWIALQETLKQTKSFRNFTYAHKSKNGETKWICLSGSPWIDDTGEFRGYHGIGSDNTSEVELQNARASAQAKDGFIASVSHELRTPLNGVLGILDILGDSQLDQDQNQLIATAKRSGESLLQLINDILDFSKIRAGHFELELQPSNITDVLVNTVEGLQPLAAKRQNKLTCTIDNPLPESVRADEQRLQQVLVNLIGNAIKFTKRGKIEVVAQLQETSQTESSITFSVSDTGPGIAKEKQSKLFEKFKMLHNPGKTGIEGTGLGLALCKTIVEAMGGEITVASEPGRGSTFSFELTLTHCEKQPSAEVGSSRSAKPTGSKLSTPIHVLLAEDNPTNALVATRFLKPLGYSIVHVENGQHAVEAFEDQQFDVVLMDVSMPIMDGVTATQRIREMEKSLSRKAIPIIALTAHASSKDREHFLANGMSSFLSKPITKPQLLQTLDFHLNLEGDTSQHEDAKKAPAKPTTRSKPKQAGSASKKKPAEPKTGKTSLPTIRISQLEQLAGEVGHDAMPGLLDTFRAEIGDRKKQLLCAKSEQNVELLKTTCHSIAGSSATIGATRLETLCRRTEDACRRKMDAKYIKIVDVLSSEIDVFLRELTHAQRDITKNANMDA